MAASAVSAFQYRVAAPGQPGGSPGQAPEPFQYLNLYSTGGTPQPLSPDPLMTYSWSAGVNTTALQLYNMLPVSASLYGSTPADSFSNLQSLVAINNVTGQSAVIVSGAGTFQVDFGVENAAWLEFDSPDLLPADAARVQLSVSEWTEPYIGKIKAPVAYNSTYRLETNAQLYEGVRFGFFIMTDAPSQPFTITGMRAVTQAKPVAYKGAFSAPGDDSLTTIFYTAIYTVRLNLEEEYFGAILMDRGDRISWAGDAHVAQAAAMTVFDVFPLVRQNIVNFTSGCNGIASYCLYWVLSLLEYYRNSGDTATLLDQLPIAVQKMEDAQARWQDPTDLTFYGWDDRLGSGFSNASTVESQFAYRFLAMRTWREWAAAMTSVGNATGAQHYSEYYNTAVAAVRSQWGPQWYAQLGVHAAADAANAQFLNDAEMAALLAVQFNDAVTVCSYSNFNQYWILQALANLFSNDLAVAAIHRCWGNEIKLGGSSFWEISHPDWATVLTPSQAMPFGDNGDTSLCHPWSAGAAPWLMRYMAGIQPLEPGYQRVKIAPHVMDHTGVSGAVPVPGGRTVAVHANATGITLHVPDVATHGAELHLSELLLDRLGWATDAVMVASERVPLQWTHAADAPRRATGERVRVAVLYLPAGVHVITAAAAAAAAAASPAAFPPPQWPGRVVAIDDWTGGAWQGKYGSAGYYLPAYGPNQADVMSLPPFIASVDPAFGPSRDQWLQPPPANDTRALQNPSGGPPAIGVLFAGMTAALDLWMDAVAAANNTWYQVAVYCVDYDAGQVSHQGYAPRRQTVMPLALPSLNPATPQQYLNNFVGGTWIVLQVNTSLRLRFSQLQGDNAVVSAVLFDLVS